MLVERISMLSGKLNRMELNVTPEEMARYEKGKELIQDVFPKLRPSEREFIKTGITDEEWNISFLA